MPLTPGARIGPYTIDAAIGAGGMGEVYRATDSNLGRHVAIKILPDSVANDPDRLARFEREARTLASLNHPNIAQIYGVENANGVRALAMELVEGPTLADRIAEGPMPVEEALPIARQIADALQAAHEQNIIHRDLKPANVKIRPDGTVKVLDVGLAKSRTLSPRERRTSRHRPRLPAPAMTQKGMILGTAAYMAPEQARGRPVDKRADIWAFGCLLFEMLAGKMAFHGEDVTETMAAVVKLTPNWAALPAEVPPQIVGLIQRCLVKDQKARVGDIAVARFVLAEDPPVSRRQRALLRRCGRQDDGGRDRVERTLARGQAAGAAVSDTPGKRHERARLQAAVRGVATAVSCSTAPSKAPACRLW